MKCHQRQMRFRYPANNHHAATRLLSLIFNDLALDVLWLAACTLSADRQNNKRHLTARSDPMITDDLALNDASAHALSPATVPTSYRSVQVDGLNIAYREAG